MSSDEEFVLEEDEEGAVEDAGKAEGGDGDEISMGKASEVSKDDDAGEGGFPTSSGEEKSNDDDASYEPSSDQKGGARRRGRGTKTPRKRKARRRKKNAKRKRRRKTKARDASSDSESEDDFIASDDYESEGNDSYQPAESDGEPEIPRRRRGARRCTARTREKMNRILQDEKRTERDVLGDAVQGDDKEYLHDTASEDDVDGGRAGRAKRAPSRKPKARRRMLLSDEEEMGEDLGSAFNEEARAALHVKPTHFQATHSAPKRKKVKCPSVKDALTKLNLPKVKPHVCCTKDGTRHCYALDTLYRVAIAKNCKKNGKLQFMRPPDFDSVLADDNDPDQLLDQIASLFTREAWVIEESSTYKEMMQRGGDYADFLRFVHTLQGCPDLYCCPLCYCEAYRRQGNLVGKKVADDDSASGDESEGDSEEEEWLDSDMGNEKKCGEKSPDNDPYAFLDDPMTILYNVGLETAAGFCFRLLSSVKEHVKTVHGLDPSVMRGNGLFQQFQIRAADGLLQRWLPLHFKEIWEDNGEAFRRYWKEEDHRDMFRELYSVIDKALLRGMQAGDYKSDFCTSFPNRAKKEWAKLIPPYLKPQRKDDVNDIIDNRSVDEGFGPRPRMEEDESDSEKDVTEDLLKRYQKFQDERDECRKNLKRSSGETGDASSGSSSGSGSDSKSESDEDEAREVEEEEPVDEWMEAKMQKPTAARRHSNEDSEDDSLFDSQPTKNLVTPHFESEEEEEECTSEIVATNVFDAELCEMGRVVDAALKRGDSPRMIMRELRQLQKEKRATMETPRKRKRVLEDTDDDDDE